MFEVIFMGETHATILWSNMEEQTVTLEELRSIQANFNEWVPYEEETCEHGLSLWLCDGPNHYPADL